ncbi:MAG: exopolysaccharide biosynthesis polyprenyl glycosylphosphotransferase, partial [Actinomycetota bacterium]|nr:exopolysaccharide biosynthesis polyprenyl glycosylphosphotransferase [Actinomycetota bacterium]
MSNEFGIGGVQAGLRRMAAFLPQLCAAFAAGLVAGAIEVGDDSTGAIVLGAYLVAGWYSARAARWRWLLPMAGLLAYGIMGALGTAISLVALLAIGDDLSLLPLALAAVAAWAALVLTGHIFSPATRIRIGVIGSPRAALRLRAELDRDQSRGFEVGATIVPDEWDFDPAALDAPYLCSLSEIGKAIDHRDLEALVVTREFDRSEVDRRLFTEVVARPVQVMELHEFHEHRFGSVPLAEIDYAWFTRLAGSHYKPLTRALKRGLDLIVAVPAVLALAPVACLLALAVRRDGGPALFRQERIGQAGRPFLINKLRTMTHEPERTAVWAEADDIRVTRLGRFLRKSHLDEAPQLWNVIRGEMSLVGPRPEQRAYVDELSRQIPFYTQRHVVKPGITGWAQVRVGYAGSLEGTAFKLCNDLYYVKHHSLSLDLAILLETFRTLVADRQYVEPPATSLTMLGEGEGRIVAAPEPSPSGAAP